MDLDAKDFSEVSPLDWERISRAYAFYSKKGYKYMEVPWVVPRPVVEATMPLGARPIATDVGEAVLIGSAEQGFLARLQEPYRRFENGSLYFSVSPCFRGESNLRRGETQLTFMKVELFAAEAVGGGSWARSEYAEMSTLLLHDAQQFMMSEGAYVTTQETPEGVDLYCAGLEVGSYGTRTWQQFRWAYGTGLAEPRFSTALAAYSSRRSRFLVRREKL